MSGPNQVGRESDGLVDDFEQFSNEFQISYFEMN